MPARTVEERLTALEQEFAQLKEQIKQDKVEEPLPWWKQIRGVFKDCPEFEEAVRLGREWRESQRMEYDDDVEGTEEKHGSA